MGDRTCKQHSEVLSRIQAESTFLHRTPAVPLNCLIFIRICQNNVTFSHFPLLILTLSVSAISDSEPYIFWLYSISIRKPTPPINIIYTIFLLTNSTIYKPDLCLAFSPCLSWPFFSLWVLEKWDCCKHRCGGMWGWIKAPCSAQVYHHGDPTTFISTLLNPFLLPLHKTLKYILEMIPKDKTLVA